MGLYFLKQAGSLFKSIDYLIDKEIKTKGEYQLTDALQHMIELGETFTTFNVQGWYDCGKSETLLSTNEILLKDNSSTKKYPGSIINNPVFIADSATLENAIIGPNTTIGEHAVISSSIIKDSIIGNDAQVEHIILEQSIVGNNASITGTHRKINIGDFSEIRLG